MFGDKIGEIGEMNKQERIELFYSAKAFFSSSFK